MSYVYAGVDSNPTSVTLPSDGDDKSAASVDVPFEAIWDRLTHLNAPEQGSGVRYPMAMQSVPRMQRHPAMVDPADWTRIPFTDAWTVNGATAKQLTKALHFPIGCSITDVLVYVKAGSGHGALPGPGERPVINLYEYDPLTETNTLLAGPVEDPESSVSIAAYEAPHAIPISITTGTVFPDPISKLYYVTLTTEDGANAEVNFRYNGVATSVDNDSVDPE